MSNVAEFWNSPSIGSQLARWVLLPASWLYAAGWQTYLAIYRLGFKKAAEPHRPVICIGNLTTGGSGKTPATLYVAQVLSALGEEVVISCSGYGSPRSEAATLAPDGPLDASEWGDEPALFRWLLPDIPLVVGRRRVLAAEIVDQRFPSSVLLMDDGFQHLPLRKHLSIVLDPVSENRFCLPAGPYREPRTNRSRADLVIPGKFTLDRATLTFSEARSGDPAEPPQRAVALCALGQPAGFFAALRKMGIGISREEALADHDPLTAGTLWDGFPEGETVVVTAKDWVKLQRRTDRPDLRLLIAMQQVAVRPEEEFAAWLKGRLSSIRGGQ